MQTIDARFVARNGRHIGRQRIGAIVYGRWRQGDADEDLVVCRRTDDTTEIHCHGGVISAQRTLTAFADAGCRIETWRDWVRTECAPVEAEARAALARAPTRRTAAVLLDQCHGALGTAIDRLLAEIDAGRYALASDLIADLIARVPLGRRLVQPARVVVAGRPNVGKSSLVNALVGYQRSIVMDFPGVTRDALAVDAAIDGWPLELIDVAGLGASRDPMAHAASARAIEEVERADLTLWVFDATEAISTPDVDLAQTAEVEINGCLRHSGASTRGGASTPSIAPLAVVNKWDLMPADQRAPNGALAVSAQTGWGLGALRSAIILALVPGAPPPGAPVPFDERHEKRLAGAAAALARGDVADARAQLAALRDGV